MVSMTKTQLFRSFIVLVFVNSVITMFVHQRWIQGVSNGVTVLFLVAWGVVAWSRRRRSESR